LPIALAQEWGGGGLDGLGMAAELLFLPLAPAACLITLWYIFSRQRAADIAFTVAWWTVVLLNVVLIVSGFWQFTMITSFNYDGTDAFNKMLLPTTVLVLFAPRVKSLLVKRRAG
jgi:hypothetical protein